MKLSIGIGLLIAAVQAAISIAAIRWAWKRPFFYWVWGGSMIFRAVVFAATAIVVYRFTNLNVAVTLVTLVTATMGFLVIEHGLSRTS